MTPGPGHNGGPTMEPGAGWRKTAWTIARAELLPTLPIEVVRMRVRRAQELGLPYKTYASVRAASGHDLIGFLFSSNALRIDRLGRLPEGHARHLATMRADRTVLVHPPVDPARVAASPSVDRAHVAPGFNLSWGDMRAQLLSIVRERGHPADRYLLVGETAFEEEWAGALRCAGFVRSAQVFPAQVAAMR